MDPQGGHPMRIIQQVEELTSVTGDELDTRLAHGWRHFGTTFYRYNINLMGGDLHRIVPLRSEIAAFFPSKSQRRVLRRNADTEVVVGPADISEEKIALFDRHSRRFEENRPQSIFDFLSRNPSGVPCECLSIDIYHEGKLIAASFLDVGSESVSSVYGIHEPSETRRGLGIFTILSEIEIARQRGAKYYYIGYGTVEPSIYDYKKNLEGLSGYDWEGNWRHLPRRG